MPSRCRTAAWAARHDQTVEMVLRAAQSTSCGERRPIGLVRERRGPRLGAGHDQAVELGSADIRRYRDRIG